MLLVSQQRTVFCIRFQKQNKLSCKQRPCNTAFYFFIITYLKKSPRLYNSHGNFLLGTSFFYFSKTGSASFSAVAGCFLTGFGKSENNAYALNICIVNAREINTYL